MIWAYKKCPRCGGDMFQNDDLRINQVYWTCLQCGYDSKSFSFIADRSLDRILERILATC